MDDGRSSPVDDERSSPMDDERSSPMDDGDSRFSTRRILASAFDDGLSGSDSLSAEVLELPAGEVFFSGSTRREDGYL